MTQTISQLHPDHQPVDLQPMTEATLRFTRAWEEGDYDFLSSLQRNLERHKKLLVDCQQATVRAAQALEVRLKVNPLEEVLEALADGEEPELLLEAQQEATEVRGLVEAQIAVLEQEAKAFASLPAVDGAQDLQRLQQTHAANAGRSAQSSQESTRLDAQLTETEKAIATLEQAGLQTRFGDTIPSIETLKGLAVPGAEAVVAAEAAGKAIKDLERLLGDIVVGMRYGTLHSRAAQLRKAAGDERVRAHGLERQQRTLAAQIAALEKLPQLVEQGKYWQAAVKKLTQALSQHRAAVSGPALTKAADVTALLTAFNRLLNAQQSLLDQLTR